MQPGKTSFYSFFNWIFLLIPFMLFSSCQARRPERVSLKSVGEIKRLSPKKLKLGYPVELTGTVTLYDHSLKIMVLQDETGAVPVEIPFPVGITRGNRVSVKGFSTYESFAPLIIKPQVQRLGDGILPVPVTADSNSLLKGEMDFSWVNLECEITAETSFGGFPASLAEYKANIGGHAINLQSGNGLVVGGRAELPVRARVTGVPISSFFPNGEVHSLTFYFGGPRFVQLLNPAKGNGEVPIAARTSANEKPGSLPVLQTIEAVKKLTNKEAEKGYPVRVRALVTYWYPSLGSLFVQDETAGVYCAPPENPPSDLKFGCLVDLEGKTGRGAFAPVIYHSHLRILKRGVDPKPINYMPAEGFAGREENRWITVTGLVQGRRLDPVYGEQLFLSSGGVRFPVRGPAKLTDTEYNSLINREVRVEGIFSPFYTANHHITGFQILVTAWRFLQVLKNPIETEGQNTPRLIHSLMEFHPEGTPKHRIKIEGQITYANSDGTLYLGDHTGGICVESLLNEKYTVGTSVQALGFFGLVNAKPVLQFAEIHPASLSATIQPKPVSTEMAFSPGFEGQLIQVEGILKENLFSFGTRLFSMECGRKKFKAILDSPQPFSGLDELREGALLKLTGICEISYTLQTMPPAPAEFRLLLRTPEDIQIIRKASWLTMSRVYGLLAVALGVIVITGGWVLLLQYQVKHKTSLLARQMQQQAHLEDQLRESRKMESIGRLAGGVAHDFNNMLTVICGYCELLIPDLKGHPEARECAQEIHKAAQKATSLVRQLLAFSRKQILQPVILDLNILIAETEKMLYRLVGEDVELITTLYSSPCWIKVDPSQVNQVIVNLAANARDAMPDGGKLILETAIIEIDVPQPELAADITPGRYVRLTITDTGIGMDENTRTHIFEPFFTTKQMGKGTGLGLSTVFGIIKQSGGHISVSSEPGQGTSFNIHFPLTSEDEQGPDQIEIQSHLTQSLGRIHETVLVVEDQLEVRQLIRKSLEKEGYHVLSTANGEEALRCAQQYTQPIHLLLTDVVMPGMNGKEVADQIQKILPAILVLFISGYSEDVFETKGILDKNINLIQKPFNSDFLLARIREMLDPPKSTDDNKEIS
jgi:signal transduction histidine kinase/CheY-like chemotaxis protein